MACFVINDALIKHASETPPATELIFVRGIMASLLVLAVAAIDMRGHSTERDVRQAPHRQPRIVSLPE
jgi:drug/metabolite transporter (DMT)-like permease